MTFQYNIAKYVSIDVASTIHNSERKLSIYRHIQCVRNITADVRVVN